MRVSKWWLKIYQNAALVGAKIVISFIASISLVRDVVSRFLTRVVNPAVVAVVIGDEGRARTLLIRWITPPSNLISSVLH